MIDKLAIKYLGDLVKSKDGSCSLTKLAAVTAHFNAAWLFTYLTLKNGYLEPLWITYLGATIFHATFDKSAKVWQSTKVTKNETVGGHSTGQ